LNPRQDFTLGAAAMAAAGVGLLWLPVLTLHLTPALFAALIVYGGTRAIAALLARRWPQLRHAQGFGLMLLITAVGLTGAIVIEHTAEAAAQGSGYAALLQQMATALDQLRALLPPWLSAHLPVSIEALREVAASWLRAHAAQIQLWGGHTVRGVGYAVAGVVIGGLLALQTAVLPEREGGSPALGAAVRRGFDRLVGSFTAVVFAQLRIAGVNTVLTAIYLLAILPMLGTPLPLAGTLVAVTFVASLVPVVGNLVSNTMIVVVSLTQSVGVAGLSLAWLVGIHKLEYFLNAHIIGQRIRASAWELLAAMLVLEALFGLAGLVSAPVIYAQLKSAWHDRGWI
jgi:predicted PurR-regulated permease PerM